MKICPECLGRFDDTIKFCATEGAALLQLKNLEEPLVGEVVNGAYIVMSLLGKGGMGRVYEAWQRSTARAVAIKTLRVADAEHAVELKQRFTREARVTAGLRSPHTITIHDFGQLEDGDFFLVMERLYGTPLDSILDDDGPLPLWLLRDVGVQVCRSLAEAHGAGIVHRDLKPSNIFMETDPSGGRLAKVLDFGVAKVVDEAGIKVTATGTAIGTIAYMSPEQIDGSVSVGPASDIYALGATLYQAAAGQLPFEADTRMALMFKHVSEPPPALTEVLGDSPEVGQLSAILRRCMAKKASQRFPDVDALRRALLEPPLGDMSAVAQDVTRRERMVNAGASAPTAAVRVKSDVVDTMASGVVPVAALRDTVVPDQPLPAPPSSKAPSMSAPVSADPDAGPAAQRRRPRWHIPAAVTALLGVGVIVTAFTGGRKAERPKPTPMAMVSPPPPPMGTTAAPTPPPRAPTLTAGAGAGATANTPDVVAAPLGAPDIVAAETRAAPPPEAPDTQPPTPTKDAVKAVAPKPKATVVAAPPTPVTRVSAPKITGTLAAGDAKKGVNALKSKLRSCFKPGDPLIVKVMVKSDGSVSRVRVSPSGARATAYESCVGAPAKALSFPALSSGGFAVVQVTVSRK